MRVGWKPRWMHGTLELAPPFPWHSNASEAAMQGAKSDIRNAMAAARRDRIGASRDWIVRLEQRGQLSPNGVNVDGAGPQLQGSLAFEDVDSQSIAPAPSRTKSGRSRALPISALIADGAQLRAQLEHARDLPDADVQLDALRQCVRPYLQLVTEGARCQYTGLKLGDIWRYFRFTWATPAETTPGRTLLYLVRDAAQPLHPVIGLASLENAPLRIADRDDYLGWTPASFAKNLDAAIEQTPGEATVRAAFARLLRNIEIAVADINLQGLCTPEECQTPTPDVLHRLAEIVARSHSERALALQRWEERNDDDEVVLERSELGNISVDAEDALYTRKRAEHLGRLLTARRALSRFLERPDIAEFWPRFGASEAGHAAVRNALLAVKNRHVGTSILELNVCGAIPPYNEILGGKLVALLMLSPQVVSDYRARYGGRPSDIASRIKGEPVVRPAEIAFVGTSSLYKVGSSQYNRLVLPAELLREGAPEVRWKKLGETEGFGTLHISRATVQSLEEAAKASGGTIANHVFGEGASPKMRSLR